MSDLKVADGLLSEGGKIGWDLKTGIGRIAAERQRQVAVEGWTPAHDNRHRAGQLALAAALYATPVPLFEKSEWRGVVQFSDAWPWPEWDKRMKHDRLRQLAIAGALVAAEIDRLLRVEASK